MPALNARRLALAAFLLLGLVHFESCAQTHDLDCCYNYTKKPLRLKMIVNYTVQSSSDVCDQDAIIFHTKSRFDVCAQPEDKWVIRIIKALRRRDKKGQKKRVPSKKRKGGKRKQG